MTAVAAIVCLWAAGLGTPHPLADQIDRLVGQKVEVSADSYRIIDVAGEGRPLVGCVHRIGDSLVLVSDERSYPLVGPLAIPRISGPNYKVWIVGELNAAEQLWVRRIGVLAGPSQAHCPTSSE